MTSAPRNNSSSLRRALSILDVLAHQDGGAGLTLTELATSVDASKSTILRLLAPLLEASLVQQRSDGAYAIGVGAVTLGSAYLNNLDLRSVAQPVLARLAAESRETVHLMVYNEAQVVYVDKISGLVDHPDGLPGGRPGRRPLDGVREGDSGPSVERGVPPCGRGGTAGTHDPHAGHRPAARR